VSGAGAPLCVGRGLAPGSGTGELGQGRFCGGGVSLTGLFPGFGGGDFVVPDLGLGFFCVLGPRRGGGGGVFWGGRWFVKGEVGFEFRRGDCFCSTWGVSVLVVLGET